MKIDRGNETIIEHDWCGFGEAKCVIGKNGGNNSDARFSLVIKDGGQIEKDCFFELCGPIERRFLKELLKQIVYEMDLIDNYGRNQ